MVLGALTVAGPVLTMATSACGVTAVTTVEVLLATTGSAVVVDTVAVLVTVPDAGAVPFTVAVKVAPLARLPAVQVNTPPAMAQPTVGVDGPARLAGNGSLMVTAAAMDGPLLVTVNV